MRRAINLKSEVTKESRKFLFDGSEVPVLYELIEMSFGYFVFVATMMIVKIAWTLSASVKDSFALREMIACLYPGPTTEFFAANRFRPGRSSKAPCRIAQSTPEWRGDH